MVSLEKTTLIVSWKQEMNRGLLCSRFCRATLTVTFGEKAQVEHGLCSVIDPPSWAKTFGGCCHLCGKHIVPGWFISPVNKVGLTCIEVCAITLDSIRCCVGAPANKKDSHNRAVNKYTKLKYIFQL